MIQTGSFSTDLASTYIHAYKEVTILTQRHHFRVLSPNAIFHSQAIGSGMNTPYHVKSLSLLFSFLNGSKRVTYNDASKYSQHSFDMLGMSKQIFRRNFTNIIQLFKKYVQNLKASSPLYNKMSAQKVLCLNLIPFTLIL